MISTGLLLGGMAGVGALGGVLGGLGKKSAAKKQLAMLRRMQRENQNWYDRRYNEDATQRADAQRLLSITEENIKNRNKGAAGKAAVMGASEESVANMKSQGNDALADVTSSIAAQGEARKDKVEQQYLQRKEALNNGIIGVQAQDPDGLELVNDIVGGATGGLGSGLMLNTALK